MKRINAHLLKGIIFIVIAMLVSCGSFFNEAFDKVIDNSYLTRMYNTLLKKA
jgi:hypothetical protein